MELTPQGASTSARCPTPRWAPRFAACAHRTARCWPSSSCRSSGILKADWRDRPRARCGRLRRAHEGGPRAPRAAVGPGAQRARRGATGASHSLEHSNSLTRTHSLDTCIAVPVRFRCLSGNPFVPMASHSFPPTPPPRRNVDLSHIRFNPDGSRFVDLAALKSRPNVQAQLQAIRKRREAAKSSSG